MRFENVGKCFVRGAMSFACAAAVLAMAGNAGAEPFVYKGRDLLLGVRQPDNVSEIVVNLGQASRFYGAAEGSSFAITNFTPQQLKAAFSSFDGLIWSVSGTTRSGDGGDASIPNATLWMTRARTAAAVQSAPWLRKSSFSQGGAANKVNELGTSTSLLSDATPADAILNTATVVVEPTGEPRSFGLVITAQGNFKGNFQGSIENNTGKNFTTATRSDLYELRPGAGDLPGKYLGYFELKADGTMSFTAPGLRPPQDPPAPTIKSIVRAGNTSTISFTTTNDASVIYRLRSINAAGLSTPLSAWTLGASSVTGSGEIRTLTDDSGDDTRFYSISVSR